MSGAQDSHDVEIDMPSREWLWWPSVKTHAIAGGGALVAVALLGIAEIPRFPAFKEFTAVQGSVTEFVVWSVVIAILNACLFFLHARGDYLDLSTGLRPIGMSFLLLSAAFPCAWALYRIIAKNSSFPDLYALASGIGAFSKGAPASADSILEWTRIFRAVFVGEAGLTMVLLFSGLWKPPPPETLEVVDLRDRTRPLLRRLFRDQPQTDLTRPQANQLRAMLLSLAERAEKLDLRLLLARDHEFARANVKNAGIVLQALDRPHSNLRDLRNSNDPDLKNAVKFLLGEVLA